MTNHEKCYKNNSFGFVTAREWFNWQKIDKVEEWFIADKLVALAELIDKNASETFDYTFEYVK